MLVVEDEPLVRKGIVTLLDYEKLNISEIYEAVNGQEAYDLFVMHSPNIVLLDINLPKLSGLEVAKRIKSESPSVKIAMLTGYDYFDYAISALKIGVEDYILKPVSKADINTLLIKLITSIENDRKSLELKEMLKSIHESEHIEDDSYKKALIQITERELGNPSFSLTILASQMGFSPGYTSTLFKTLMGQSFQDYMLSSRLEKSKLLLLTTDLKVYEVAEHVGFEDVNYFSVRFKKMFGLSPKKYSVNVRSTDD
ncbi:MAG: response regulator [Gudongella sp.]|nr:response regulator [Gudongella sp.]